MSSRILARNRRGFSNQVGEVAQGGSLPPKLDPKDPNWQWPTWVDNSVKFAQYVYELHERKGLLTKWPQGAYMKFATMHKYLGFEKLVRAATLAAIWSNHPFSPKLIKTCLSEVPSGIAPQILF